ncbi:unnamed protein product [Durusdinium trenchii]|uniref:Protein kinase domain-containing protein n=2 Tax=Durusdinium trenchii TaxID=1381693 RepID=A0ABP0Q8K8_9DINO
MANEDEALAAIGRFLKSSGFEEPAKLLDNAKGKGEPGLAARLQELGSKLLSLADVAERGRDRGSWTEQLLRRFADQALQQEAHLQEAMSQRLANGLRERSCSEVTTGTGSATPAATSLEPSAYYVPRTGSDVNYDPDITEEYRDDLDPGYRIREVTEQELMEEIQEKYQRALAAAPELMPWAQGLLPPEDHSGDLADDDELLGAPKTDIDELCAGVAEAPSASRPPTQPSGEADGTTEHTLADAIRHGVPCAGDAEAGLPSPSSKSANVPAFGGEATTDLPGSESVAATAALAMAQPDPAPKALCCARKERKNDGRPPIRYPDSGDSFYPVELDGVVYDSFNLRIIHERDRTGFEETKDFPIRLNSIVAGRYQVLEYLGSAAFSRAVQCLDLETNRMVCMKIINNNKDFFDQSLDEIKLLRLIRSNIESLDEKNCLGLVDYFYHKEHLIIVTELLRDNLYEFSKYNRQACEEPYFTLGRLQRISQQVLAALEYIHQLYLIHADLKPENILIKSYSRCEVKVIDFGSSCFVDDSLTNYVQSRSYRAPEVILGLAYDQKIDLWSLGCIIAELWSGFVLFQNDSVQSLLARIVGILGPFPAHMMATGRSVPQYFTQDGRLFREFERSTAPQPQPQRRMQLFVPKRSSLRQRMRTNDEAFLDFLASLLQVDPCLRPTATEALKHPFLSPGRYSDGYPAAT